jgi:paired-like homeodomain transcription factor 2
MNAIAAADFKNGFGNQFVQPFADTDTLYSSYSHYNNWAKVPSPLGTKTFPWPVNPLGSVVSTNHHQNSINCFNSSSSVAASMNTAAMLPSGMGTSLGGGTPGGGGAQCPYTTQNNPYTMYHHRASVEPCNNTMSSSIATLRLKAKQHTSGFASPYSAPSPVSRSNSASLSLSACQYAGVSESV